jgi:hypothetical protein
LISAADNQVMISRPRAAWRSELTPGHAGEIRKEL